MVDPRKPLLTLTDIEGYRLWAPQAARFSSVLSAFAAEEVHAAEQPT